MRKIFQNTLRAETGPTPSAQVRPRSTWRSLRFKECLKKQQSKGTPSIQSDKYQQCGRFPIIDQGAGYIAGWTDSEEAVIKHDLPVVVFGDHTRIFKYVDFPFATGADGTKILRADPDLLDALFFYYALKGLQIPNKGYNRHYKYLRDLPFAFPVAKSEQRTIAQALQTVQKAKETRQRELALERERKAALMEYLFTHGTRGEAKKQTEIGEIPVSWQVEPLSAIAELVSGGTPSRENADWWKGAIPWASPKDMKKVLLADTEEHVSKEAIEAGSRLVPSRSIFIVIRGMILAKNVPIALTDVPMAFNQDMKAVLPRDGHYPEFLLYALIWRKDGLARHIGTSAHGTRRLSTAAVGSLLIPIPPFDEQVEIARVLSSCEAKINTLKRELHLHEELFGTMLEELMTGRLSAVPLIEEHQAP